MGDMWVFGYGSLMWRPGFTPVETRMARLHGYHRSLCIYSHIHRGSVERPGLVLGLKRGGSCDGLALRIPEAEAEDVLSYLRERELANEVYHEKIHDLHLDDGRIVDALVYVADETHAQFADNLSAQDAAYIICSAVGISGPNIDYVVNTVSHLQAMGLQDSSLENIASLLNEKQIYNTSTSEIAVLL